MALSKEQKSLVVVLQKGIEGSQFAIRSILKCLEQMFDQSIIFSHRELKSEINKSKNGYVKWKFVFSLSKFKNQLSNFGLELAKCEEPLAGALFHYNIKKYSKRLKSNPGGVRRLSSFDGEEIKYLLARNYPSFQEFKLLISSQTCITKIQEDTYNNMAIISTTDPELIASKYNGCVWKIKEGSDLTGDEQEQIILRVYSNSDYLRYQEHSKQHWSQNRFSSLYSVRRLEAYPCRQEYLARRYKDQEIDEKEVEEHLTDEMEEES